MRNQEISIATSQDIETSRSFTHQEAELLKKETVWRNLAGIPLSLAIDEWLNTLSPLTEKNYKSGIKKLSALKLIDVSQDLQAFALINHDAIIDRIKKIPGLSEATKQARAALYISFTRFLSRRTEGLIKRAVPCKEGTIATTKTFGQTRDTVKAEALTMAEWKLLISALESGSKRDALIVKVCLQGAKRIRETLGLTIDKIDFENRQAIFKQSKTKGIAKEIIVNLPESLAVELKDYIGDRKDGAVFITSNGKATHYTTIYEGLKRAAKKANIEKNVHPHVLRASAITFHRARGARDCEILRLTGHSSTQMLNLYDKASRADNASLVSLV